MENNFDQWIFVFLGSHRNNLGIEIFKIITFFGDWQFLLPVILIILVILYIKNKKRFITPYILIVSIAEIVTYIGKILFNRSRPLLAVLHETDPSFPSGHATIAVTFYGYLAYIIIKSSPKRYKLSIIIMAILIIVLIGFSRLYLGVHYVSDVLAGYLVGLVFLVIGINFTNKFNTNK